MENSVTLELRDGIAVLVLDAPPVNALSADLRTTLATRLTQVLNDSAVKAVVLRAAGRLFSAGADIREFGQVSGTPKAPNLSVLCQMIEDASKPVIVALHGAALGGGAEIALAAHYRLALSDATIGLPEVTLGLIPGGGGTQRLPRLVGAVAALDMMLEGRPISAAAALEMGLIDAIVPDDLPDAAFAFAQGLIASNMGPRPTAARRDRMSDGVGWLAIVRKARSGTAQHAQGKIVDCVEAALLLPFHAGMEFERSAFEACLAHPQSRALRHLFLAERRVSPTLMARDQQGGRTLTPAGQAAVARLAAAQLRAAEALVRAGEDVTLIEEALVGQDHLAGQMQDADNGVGRIARMINAAVMAEGCRLIGEGIARDMADVDVLAVMGLGYPRLTGGPMKAAEIAGLRALRSDMVAWSADDPVWAVPPLLEQAVRYAGGFSAIPGD